MTTAATIGLIFLGFCFVNLLVWVVAERDAYERGWRDGRAGR